MTSKEIPDWLVCEAVKSKQPTFTVLRVHTGHYYKVCRMALDRAYCRGLVSSRINSRLTAAGKLLLTEHKATQTTEEREALAQTIKRLENMRASINPKGLDGGTDA